MDRKETKRNRQTETPDQPADHQIPAYHQPVLLQEVLTGLQIKQDGLYVDCTFGGGGHAAHIAGQMGSGGKLVVFDQDDDARRNLPDDPRFLFVASNFRHLQRFLRLHGISQIDGLLADLGVSSHQFNEAERGFSTRFDGELDMRMDKRQSLTAYQVVNTYTEQQLHKIFEQYGEVTNARTLAKTIVDVRRSTSLGTTGNFKNALRATVKGNPHKWFAQVFQALRIEVNDELGALKELLQQVPPLLKPGGRIAVITFHSMEDRIVKQFFRKGTFEEDQRTPFGQNTVAATLQTITKKPIIPGEQELKQNPRSRSAKLRIAERLNS